MEANDLRFCLVWMAIMHLTYIFFFSVSWRVMMIDSLLLKLCFKSILTLKKFEVIKYVFSMTLFSLIGLTHCFYQSSFKSGLEHSLFVIQMVFYIFASYSIVQKLKVLIVVQEIIRVVNYHQNLKGRVKLKMRARLTPTIAKILKERIQEIMEDPDEDVFFSSKHLKGIDE